MRPNRPHKRSQATGLILHNGGLAPGFIQATKHGLLALLEPSWPLYTQPNSPYTNLPAGAGISDAPASLPATPFPLLPRRSAIHPPVDHCSLSHHRASMTTLLGSEPWIHHELSRRGLDRPPIPPSSSDGPFNCWAFLAGLKHSDPQRPSTALFGRISGGSLARSPLQACTALHELAGDDHVSVSFNSSAVGRGATERSCCRTGRDASLRSADPRAWRIVPFYSLHARAGSTARRAAP